MSTDRWISISAKFALLPLALVLPFAATGIALAAQESTIFSYDGQDFVQVQTTLSTEDGKSAVNTKLAASLRPTSSSSRCILIRGTQLSSVKNAMPTMLRSAVPVAR
jgi:hypothetical protein